MLNDAEHVNVKFSKVSWRSNQNQKFYDGYMLIIYVWQRLKCQIEWYWHGKLIWKLETNAVLLENLSIENKLRLQQSNMLESLLEMTLQKDLSTAVLMKRCSENMQQNYRTRMPKYSFSKVARQLYWNHTSTWHSPVNLQHILGKHLSKKLSQGALLALRTEGIWSSSITNEWRNWRY